MEVLYMKSNFRNTSLRFLAALVAVLCLFATSAFSVEFMTEVVPLERAGIKLHLQKLSRGDKRMKDPILFVHGLTYSSHEFDVNYGDYSLARYFASNGYDVWTLDIAGYGSSQEVKNGFMPNSDYAAEDIAAAAKLILERTGRSKMDFLGWSWGTVTSGRFAAKYPEMVRKIVLYAPIVAGLLDAKVEVPFNKNTWLHAAGDFQVKEDGSIDYNIVEPAVADTFLSNCWRYDKDSSPNGGRADLLVSPEKRLIPTAKIKAPVLLIAGSKDQYVTPELCQEAFATLQNKDSQLEIIDGAAHAVMMEKPYYKAFREKILDFLQK